MNLPFVKMNGAGNDFVIFDGRRSPVALSADQARAIAARDNKVTKGCDQVIVLEKAAWKEKIGGSAATSPRVFMRIYNADGSESSSCGNATRCIAWLLMEETGQADVAVETRAGLLDCRSIGDRYITVDMGAPKLAWHDIPLREACDTQHLPISHGTFSDPVAVSMGNPHMVFVVENTESVPLKAVGPVLENHPLYPQRANVSFAQVVSDKEIILRVWERGAGATLACGTAACATLVALHQRGLVGRQATLHLPGGDLDVHWDEATDHVWLAGPVEVEFEGTLALVAG